MKKILALICIAFLASCSVNTSKIDGGNIDPDDIVKQVMQVLLD